MCLILLSYDQHPRYRLVLAANRDEFYDRPTTPAAFWEDDGILAGRDQRAGGTWLGITRAGRWAAVTNYRDLRAPREENAPSRGGLVTGFLRSGASPSAFLEQLAPKASRYNGFNLLAGTPDTLGYLSNRADAMRMLDAGRYGISNDLLDTPWPKVERGKVALADALQADAVDPDALLDLLADTTPAPDAALPDTGLGLERERMASSMFIRSPDYGTRSSTVLLIGREGTATFVERFFEGSGEPTTRRFSFALEPAPRSSA